MLFLKEDTSATIRLGPFVDKTDGVTYEVGMAAAMDSATTGIRISKNGAAFADRNDATAPVYDAFGYYSVVLDATDTSTPGTLQVIFGDAAVCLPCEANFMVVNANVFNSLFAAATTDYLQVDAIQVGGTAQTAGDVTAKIDTIDGIVDAIVIDTARLFDATATGDADSPVADSIAESLRQTRWFVANKWDIDETATPDTLTIFKDDTLTTGMSFQVYTSASHNYRIPV